MAQWDVFSSRPLEGNSLAIFLDGRELADTEMQSIAKEMNLSETTFILPRDAATEREEGVRVRIFTVQEELPFAGHPTLGTAFALRGQSGAEKIVLALNVGKVPVHFEENEGQPTFGEMTQIDPTFGMQHDREAVSSRYGIARAGFRRFSAHRNSIDWRPVHCNAAEIAGCHTEFLAGRLTRAAEYLAKTAGKFFYFVTRETVDRDARLHARMLFYNGEDPATGSAAGCAAAWMVAHGIAKPDERV